MNPRTVALALGTTFLLLGAGVSLAQEGGCPPNAHVVDHSCRCDAGYVSLDGSSCVPESQACSGFGAAHLEGGKCVCNEGYGAFDGADRCVSGAAHCEQLNAVFKSGVGCVCRPGDARFGDDRRCVSGNTYCAQFNAVFTPSTGDCDCPPGHGILPGEKQCVSLASVCARYDAVYNKAKNECECPAGTVENERLERCVPAERDPGAARAPEAVPSRPAAPPPAPEPPRAQAPAPAPAPRTESAERRATPPPVQENRPATAHVGSEKPVTIPGGLPREPDTAGLPLPPARGRTSSGRTDSAPPPNAPPGAASPPSRTSGIGTLTSSPPTPPPPDDDRSEPVITMDYLSALDSSEEDRERRRSFVLEAMADQPEEQVVEMENQITAYDSFMGADLGSSGGDGEVQIGPVMDSMMKARQESRVQMAHREKMAEHRARVREAKEAGKLRPGVDREAYEALKRQIERTLQSLAWAEKEHMHQHKRFYEANFGDEDNPHAANFKFLGKEHAERFGVPVGKEKKYDGLTADVVQAVASRDCIRNIDGAYGQILDAREALRRQERELESLLDLPEEPAIEDTRQEVIPWYPEDENGS